MSYSKITPLPSGEFALTKENFGKINDAVYDLMTTSGSGISANAGATFEATVQGFPASLAGTVGVQIIDNVGGVSVARTTSGIAEVTVLGVGSGIYTVTLTAPATPGQYTLIWDRGVGGASNVATESLLVR